MRQQKLPAAIGTRKSPAVMAAAGLCAWKGQAFS
jgi:hypothetical protein